MQLQGNITQPIFSYLTPKESLTVRKVCKNWNFYYMQTVWFSHVDLIKHLVSVQEEASEMSETKKRLLAEYGYISNCFDTKEFWLPLPTIYRLSYRVFNLCKLDPSEELINSILEKENLSFFVLLFLHILNLSADIESTFFRFLLTEAEAARRFVIIYQHLLQEYTVPWSENTETKCSWINQSILDFYKSKVKKMQLAFINTVPNYQHKAKALAVLNISEEQTEEVLLDLEAKRAFEARFLYYLNIDLYKAEQEAEKITDLQKRRECLYKLLAVAQEKSDEETVRRCLNRIFVLDHMPNIAFVHKLSTKLFDHLYH